MWVVVVVPGVVRLFLYWARLALAPRTGHTGVACRNMCDVVAIVMAPVPVVVALVRVSVVLVIVCDFSVFVVLVTVDV